MPAIMASLAEIAEDEQRLYSVIDRKDAKGLAWSVSRGRKLFSGAFALMMFAQVPVMAYWAFEVWKETGQSPFFNNGFDYEYEEDGQKGVRHFGKLKFASLESGTVQKELTARMEGDTYKPLLLNDPRITPVGKRMRAKAHDESPQLFNLLMREMSAVGLRTGKIEFQLDILPNGEREPFRTYLRLLRQGVLPGLIPATVVCPNTRGVTLERRVGLQARYDRDLASFKNDCLLVAHFFSHRGEILRQ